MTRRELSKLVMQLGGHTEEQAEAHIKNMQNEHGMPSAFLDSEATIQDIACYLKYSTMTRAQLEERINALKDKRTDLNRLN